MSKPVAQVIAAASAVAAASWGFSKYVESKSGSLGIQDIVEDAIDFIQAQGQMGPVYYAIFLALWITCLLPCSVVEIVPGFLYGFKMGFVVSLCGKLLGALFSFTICHTFLKEPLKRWFFDHYPSIQAIGRAVKEEGLPVLVVVRFSYVPMIFKNYGLGVLEVGLTPFMTSAFLAGVPFSLLWATLGAEARDLQSILKGERSLRELLPEDNTSLGLLVAGFCVIIGAAIYVLRNVRARVNEKMNQFKNEELAPTAIPNESVSRLLQEQQKNGIVKSTASNDNAVVAAQGTTLFGGLSLTTILGICFLLCIGIALHQFRNALPSLSETMQAAVAWIREQGEFWGPVYYILFLSVWVAALLPCSILEMVPGYLFGFRKGVFVSIIGKNLGTVMSLLLTRFFLRDLVQRRLLKRFPILRTLEKAVKMEGFPVIVMIRCAYLPMIIKNYGLASLDIDIFKIWVASLLSSGPFAAAWTAVGASATNLTDIFDGKMKLADVLPQNYGLTFSLGFVFVLFFIYALTSFMKRFRQILREVENEEMSSASSHYVH
mmetsp:Transcript_20342/g.39963  ORF Transcript_20342/g.39963 Transcript_20342/m.39963 type:complete len:546 (+) Transcript_20342:303-1940(+)|eukprot:CAMPEP_0171497622 /NCGR_PEP_ID=MMETSP0958-20121227/7378_1 /TAXON_ID=87120 /ORGANISM="Aurantiochytrium limacinum, Strain ATCCMYA-1381" /LENGTH=545 /DNA_ID=CAMNT_0012031893 /DNA_START=247 /DNA_END=1884 /DNA_ORIENTATION=+